MWAASSGAIAYCSAKVRKEQDDRTAPLTGVLGAFLFAAQMINFSIPGTGSSGHIGGGLLLAILLGPHAAFLAIASVLVVQALFFADGGLLALGCNIVNLGFFPAFVAYPCVYRKVAGTRPGTARITIASISAAVAGLLLGAFAVVMETVASGISSLPFPTFVALMLPIHLPIGIVEGFVTAVVVSFVSTARPEILQGAVGARPTRSRPLRNVLLGFLAAAALTGGVLSWFASGEPDGLEWSVAKAAGTEEVKRPVRGIHGVLASLQEKIAFFPDYSFRKPAKAESEGGRKEGAAKAGEGAEKEDGSKLGTSVSGIVGGLITLAVVFLTGFLLKRQSRAA
jgi:cobalt/nickel transport system permease protein